MDFRIGAVVVTYNRKDLLIKSINSLLNQTRKLERIIVIDNNSTDGTKEELEKQGLLNNDIIYYKKLERNLGGSGGFYYGIKTIVEETNVDWVLLTDDDAIYDSNFVSNIKDYYERHPSNNIVALTGTVIEHGEISTIHRRILKDQIFFRQEPVCVEKYKQESFDYDLLSFVGAVIKVDVIKKVGLPCKDFFIWYDDTEYSIRLREYGKIINVNSALVYHETRLGVKSTGYQPNWKEFYGLRNLSYLILKHTRNRLLSNLYLFLIVIKMLLSTLMRKTYKGYRKYRVYLILDSYYSALRGKLGLSEKYRPSL